MHYAPSGGDLYQTRTQVLELGPRDLEPLHHDPHCILVAEDAFDGEATDEDATDEDETDDFGATPLVHHLWFISSGASALVHQLW